MTMPVTANFVMQVALYSIVPFYLGSLRNPIRVTYSYIYISILLIIEGFLSGIYALPVSPTLNISGGSFAYGALLMSTVLLVILERDLITVRRVIELVILINVFKIF